MQEERNELGERQKTPASEHQKVRDLALCAMFTVLIAAGAFLKVPVPVVPFTLQFLFTMLAGLLLGGRRGAVSVGVYLALGLLGLPIFAEGGGIWYLLKPSFGYLIGFLVATYVTGTLVEKGKEPTVKGLLGINLIGLGIVYSMGLAYDYMICNFVIDAPVGLWPLFFYGFILAVPGDFCLCILAAFLTKRIKPALEKMRY